MQSLKYSTVSKLGALQRQVHLQGVFVKIGDYIKFKGFFSGVLKEQALLRKSNTPRKSPEKCTFPSLTFYNAPSLPTTRIYHSVQSTLPRSHFSKVISVRQQTETWIGGGGRSKLYLNVATQLQLSEGIEVMRMTGTVSLFL